MVCSTGKRLLSKGRRSTVVRPHVYTRSRLLLEGIEYRHFETMELIRGEGDMNRQRHDQYPCRLIPAGCHSTMINPLGISSSQPSCPAHFNRGARRCAAISREQGCNANKARWPAARGGNIQARREGASGRIEDERACCTRRQTFGRHECEYKEHGIARFPCGFVYLALDQRCQIWCPYVNLPFLQISKSDHLLASTKSSKT